MKRAAFAVLTLLLAATVALADGQNPDLMIGFETTNPPPAGGAGLRVDPSLYVPFDVYVTYAGFGPGGGLLGASFGVVRTFTGFKTAFENLMGGLVIGDPEVAPYCAITSGANPVYPDGGTGKLVVAKITYVATASTPGQLTFVCHQTDGCVAADANNDLDVWVDYGNLGVFQNPPASPVDATSWGAIKALYR